MPENQRIEYGVKSWDERTKKHIVRVYEDEGDADDWYDYLVGRDKAYHEVHVPEMMTRVVKVSEWKKVNRYAKS